MKTRISWLFVIVLIAVAMITNPGIDRHREAAAELVHKEMNKELTQGERFTQAIGLVFGAPIINTLVDGFVSRENYVVFSLTKIINPISGKEQIVGIGAFGYVYIPPTLTDIVNNKLTLL